MDQEEKDELRYLTQYSKFGNAYCPTSSTVLEMRPGIYRIVEMNQRYVFDPHSFVTDHLIDFPDSKSAEIINEIARFWTLEPKFKQFGFTYKRGMLMYGPPGTGKTSTLVSIMNAHVKNDGIVVLGSGVNAGILSHMLQQLRQVERTRKLLVVIEDVENMARQGQAFTSLLDGEDTVNGVVFLATTNYIDRLEDRIKNRPSRFDKVVEIGPPGPIARGLYLKARGIDAAVIPYWVKVSEGFSFAHLKELVISVAVFGNDLEESAVRLAKMLGVVVDKPATLESLLGVPPEPCENCGEMPNECDCSSEG